jgi:hypothetical protein
VTWDCRLLRKRLLIVVVESISVLAVYFDLAG